MRGELATKVAELTGQLGGDYSTLAPVIGQLTELARELTSKPSARSMRGPADEQPITMTATLARREVAYFPLDRPVRGRPAEMVARVVVASLTDTLTEYSDLGIGCDCLVWIDGCETLDARQLGALISLGTRTGAAVALGTTVAATAAALAAQVNVIALRGSSPPGLGSQGLGNQVSDDRLPPERPARSALLDRPRAAIPLGHRHQGGAMSGGSLPVCLGWQFAPATGDPGPAPARLPALPPATLDQSWVTAQRMISHRIVRPARLGGTTCGLLTMGLAAAWLTGLAGGTLVGAGVAITAVGAAMCARSARRRASAQRAGRQRAAAGRRDRCRPGQQAGR